MVALEADLLRETDKTPAPCGHDACTIAALGLGLDPAEYFHGWPIHDRPCDCQRWVPNPIPDTVKRAYCGFCGGWLKGGADELKRRRAGRPRQTQCRRGHPYDGKHRSGKALIGNSYVRPDGTRECRLCQAEVRKEGRVKRVDGMSGKIL